MIVEYQTNNGLYEIVFNDNLYNIWKIQITYPKNGETFTQKTLLEDTPKDLKIYAQGLIDGVSACISKLKKF